jgi:uncharacterized membrane protein YfcA
MDTPLVLGLVLGLAAFGTAVLSATLGMAGGLVLMGVYAAVLPVPEAMVLHGVTQFVANGGRAWLLRRHVDLAGCGAYALGAVLAWFALRAVAFVPDAATVYLGLGLVPFVALLVPGGRWLDFGWRPAAAACGVLVAGTQMLFGVAGPLLDVFFVRTRLDRHAIVATKALTQTMSHVLKVTYFLPALTSDGPVGLGPAAGVAVVAAIVGTRVGNRLLERISDEGFRRATRWLVLGIGAVYLVRGGWMLGAGG